MFINGYKEVAVAACRRFSFIFPPLVYGYRETALAAEELTNAVCPDCGQHGLVCFVFSNHVHFFWIPLFPISKRKEIDCPHCEQTYTRAQLLKKRSADKREISRISRSAKTPLWKFSGIALVILLIGLSIGAKQLEKNRPDRLLNNPKIHDIYWVKGEFDTRSTIRIEIIEDDSIYFAENQYYIASSGRIKDIDKNKNYNTAELFAISKDDLKQLREDRIIYNITRKNRC
ncbi:MAG: hypothetical protein FWE10_06685 [Rikenellaceae bacterium]|nr:hypothetical protein [Rikenellaceae bacterium]MCL2692503.1 hypothetical protein [Rikenellaceae bacterium]